MTTSSILDMDRVREMFDLRGSYVAGAGGGYATDPYPIWRELRERGAVHLGTVHELSGTPEAYMFHGLPEEGREHFSVFTYAACDQIYKDAETYASSPDAVDLDDGDVGPTNSMLSMGGQQHRRYRTLVQPSFVPAKAQWWITNWIQETVDLLIEYLTGRGRAELNTEFCASIPILTIAGSFGIPISQALDIRDAVRNPMLLIEIIRPIVAARRESPKDDLISVLIEAELTDEDGTTHTLSDLEIYSFTALLLAAGSGTTWKQMGLVLTALLERPDVLEAVRQDRSLLRNVIEESVRWTPTDPMFSRWVTMDTELEGVAIPKGAVVHLCIGAANRDPARWDNPEVFDITRPLKPTFGFGGGQHICLGMHVAKAEITVGVNAILDNLQNVRLDPDADAPRYVGFYERGATAIPVLFD
jgi:cytochrome P450